MKYSLLLLIFLLPLLAIKCLKKEEINSLINIRNESGKDLYCMPSYIFPDTSLAFTNKDLILSNENSYLVKSGETKKIGQIPLCNSESWDKHLPHGRLILFYFEKSVVQNNTWSDIEQKSMYYKVVTYQFTDLKDCNLIVK